MTGGGKLKVQVVNGRGLQNKETFQTSDPYCKLEVGGVSHKTKHVNSNLNPDWNETFEFDIKPGMDVIALSIWDKNTIKKDAFMGYSFVTFDDCKKDQEKKKSGEMLGGCSGVINLIIRPNFETSASKIERLDNHIKQANSGDDNTSSDLQSKIQKFDEDNTKLTTEKKQLENQIIELTDKIGKLSEQTKSLSATNDSLKVELNGVNSSNATLSENAKKLTEEINKLKAEIMQLKSQKEEQIITPVEVKEQESQPSIAIYQKLNAENDKLIKVKEELLDRLLGFQTVQELVFCQLKQKMNDIEKEKSNDKIRHELKEQIMGFEKVQELIFNQFNGKMKTFDLSLLKEIVMEVKAFEQC